MSKLLASTLLVLVLSTVGVASRPVGFGTHFALTTEELVGPLVNGEPMPWCRDGNGFQEFIWLSQQCLFASHGYPSYTGNEHGDFQLCCSPEK
ncbi:hypothetical protein BSKO_02481 [Bryopsis sp. KO-2023]|nr:hypothetical protein BSKO_02481 [Bryopsis sp. KO-2023]